MSANASRSRRTTQTQAPYLRKRSEDKRRKAMTEDVELRPEVQHLSDGSRENVYVKVRARERVWTTEVR